MTGKAVNDNRIEQRTFARFFRHSVQALGVTTPSPRLLFEFWDVEPCPEGWAELEDVPVAAGVGWL